ncbi:hypothetical protein [Aliarcobacter butzleri]|uniref:hypothetical protein n=1 Tax=Aliarcobacter butzleri TaxID=28197 RepID=UPI00126A3290|nr:hypothetical protein [Aliarcobacter butzleri]
MAKFQITKLELELLMEKAKMLKEKMNNYGHEKLFTSKEDFDDVVKELDYIISSLYIMVNPKKTELKFDKKMSDLDFVKYAIELTDNLDMDLREVLSA